MHYLWFWNWIESIELPESHNILEIELLKSKLHKHLEMLEPLDSKPERAGVRNPQQGKNFSVYSMNSKITP